MKATYTEIKICGITRLEDALCAVTCGADAVGFIFHKESPRYIAPEQAKAIIAQLPGEVAKVGVFVNRKTEEVERIVEGCGLDLIQLHGDESPAYCRLFPPERVIKAVSPRSPEEVRALDVYEVRALLVDARDAGRYGGTGKRADWKLAASIGKKHSPDPRRRSRREQHRRGARRRLPPRRRYQQRLRAGAGDQGSRPDAADHRADSGDDSGDDSGGRSGQTQGTIHRRGTRAEVIFDNFVKK